MILRSDNDWNILLSLIAELKPSTYQGPLMEVLICEYKKDRSDQQNSFYWSMVVEPFAAHTGNTKNEMHDILLKEVFGTKRIEFNGKIYEVPNRRTTSPERMNKQEFSEYIEHCTRLAVENGVPIPEWEYLH